MVEENILQRKMKIEELRRGKGRGEKNFSHLGLVACLGKFACYLLLLSLLAV